MLIQKFHAALYPGETPTVAATGAKLFSRQGHWDGGSTLHCVAMALALLGRIDDPVWLPYHDEGTESIVWDHSWPHYLHGLTLSELASFIAELNISVRPRLRNGDIASILRFSKKELIAGSPVIVGWNQPHPISAHAALAIGIEGRQKGRSFEPHSLLLLDPAGDMPTLAGFNARLDRHGDDGVIYRSANATRAVCLKGAVSINTATGSAVA
ncbi:hypothetical protein [Burkholderia thailandensis]|uniref:hypothetical protein n=1 Tax=Burkholderia thailandensis TaxID=57975 RepID=UPI0013780F94|nr:hypothetical protein [Burkholderia thailandensis]MCS6477380.1 hypothetical protein [Burkholderia thailandensis]MCS6511927.1 hypothetical protein [Burkholderia thailandensis]NBD05271.1 hypothetical protein [Burkholderia thailandensis]